MEESHGKTASGRSVGITYGETWRKVDDMFIHSRRVTFLDVATELKIITESVKIILNERATMQKCSSL